MKKDEAESAIRHLCHVWRTESGRSSTPEGDLYFSDFLTWVEQKYPQCLTFRSRVPALDVVETWFDQEFKQSWRN